MKNKAITGLLLSLFLNGCSTPSTLPEDQSSAANFDSIKLGQSPADVKKIIGPPTVSSESREAPAWFYDKDESQRAAIAFDEAIQKVEAVTFLPHNNEKEKHLDYLLNQKFPGKDYVKIPRGRCFRDYIPKEVFYISPSNGVSIEVDSLDGTVESYTRSSREEAKNLIEKLKNCKI